MNALMQQHETWKGAHQRLMGVTPAVPQPLFCPCCGHEVEGNSQTRALAILAMSPACRTILNMLSAAYPQPVLGSAFTAALWTARGKSKPFRSQRILSVHAFKINERIRPYGWELQAAFLDAGSRRLVRLRKENTQRTDETVGGQVGKVDLVAPEGV